MTIKHLIDTVIQRPNESISYYADAVNLGTPTSPTTTVYEVTVSTSEDVTSTVGSPSASIANTTEVYTGAIGSLTDGSIYHAVIKFTVSGNVFEYYWIINCSDHRPAESV